MVRLNFTTNLKHVLYPLIDVGPYATFKYKVRNVAMGGILFNLGGILLVIGGIVGLVVTVLWSGL